MLRLPAAIRSVMLATLLVAGAIGSTAAAWAGTLDKLRTDKVIRIAYREDAPPFSYKSGDGQPAGYMIDLCNAVVRNLAQQLQMPSLNPVYVPVTASDRFAAISEGKADLLCEATTASLTRRKLVDFSIPTFIDGASLLAKGGGPSDLRALAGRKVGVLGSTTTEQELRKALSAQGIAAEVIAVKSHAEGIGMLDDGNLAAYFADRAILAYLLRSSKAPDQLALADQYLTIEPYALALPRDDGEFRLAVDRALSQIYRSGEIVALFQRTFGTRFKPSQIVQNLYTISALPE
jgi:ABC-type amino acid transport substrate-binding protein